MKTQRILLAMLSLFTGSLYAQPISSCVNADFELNSFSNWVARTGYCFPITMTGTGTVAGRHTLISPGGFDQYSNGNIPLVPTGFGNRVVRLGNDNTGSEAERLSYPFSVAANNALFIYRYAVVLEDPGHPAADQPRFNIRVFDQSGVAIPCGTYNVVASGSIPGFINIGDYRVKPWATVGIDLSAYIGQTVTIEFTTADCGWGGHFGYAYLECYCSPFQLTSDFCPGIASTTLTAPAGFANYLWNTGDTTSSITIANPINGATYSCTMTSYTGCQVTLTTVLVPTNILADFYVTSNCANHVTFIDSSVVLAGTAITQWNWDFGDGTTSNQQFPVHSYDSSGTFNVHLTASNAGGCFDSITIPIQTIPFPDALFSYPGNCNGSAVNFTDLSTFPTGSITDWLWDFGDATAPDSTQNPVHMYASSSSHTASLIVTASNGCLDTFSTTVSMVPLPVADFSMSPGCEQSPLLFTDGSSATAGTIVSFSWDFGDGGSSALQNPQHTYASAGTYAITLIVTTSNGCVDTISQQAVVNHPPVAGFTFLSACMGEPVTFTDQSAVTNGTIVNYLWNFGDSTVQTGLPDPSHFYAAPGFYTVTLQVVSDSGCAGTFTQTVEQKPLPAADFTAIPACPNEPVLFTDQSAMVNGSILSWQWDFGDGSPVSQATDPTHIYTSGGSHTVTQIVTGSNGCTDTMALVVEVKHDPLISFTSNPVCLGTDMYFNDGSTLVNGTVTGWIWNFGDGSPLTIEQNPVHHYYMSGNFQVALTVTGNNGCESDSIITAEVFPLPVPSFGNLMACVNNPMQFTDQSVPGAGQLVSWSWNFDDSSASQIQNPMHVFTDPMFHTVNVIVTTNNGCVDSIQQDVFVSPLPDPVFTAKETCYPGGSVFTDASTAFGSGITSWNWDFGDGSAPEISPYPVHHFPAGGHYSVRLVVQSGHGCVDSISRVIDVWRKPVADFVPSDTAGCEPMVVTFINTSASDDGAIIKWEWSFGNGQMDSIAATGSLYWTGVYPVSLIVTSAYGCRDTVAYDNLVTVYPKPFAGFSHSPTQTNIYDPLIKFHDASYDAVQWYWNFGDGTHSEETEPLHAYMEAGIFRVMQFVTSVHGCLDTLLGEVVIDPEYMYNVPNAFTPNGDGTNEVFCGKGIGIKDFRMDIFDRWGKIIFSTSDYRATWDGTYKDSPVQEDVYVYKIHIIDVFERPHNLLGSVSVIK